MRVLVTGGGGFIGSHLVERLLDAGHHIRVLDNFSTGRRENLIHLAGEVELIEGDVQSCELVHSAVSGCEVVFHQADIPSVPWSIQDPVASHASNVIGTLNVLLAARDGTARRVVFASSSSVYGASDHLPKHEGQAPLPISPYAVGKLAGEGYCRSFSAVYGLETVALRYFNVFGARQDPLSQYAAVVPNFIVATLSGSPPTIFGDGEQSRDFTFVSDVVDANLLAMTAQGISGRTFNVASGERISLNHVISELRAVTGRPIDPRYTEPRVGDIVHSLADISAARAALGFVPKVDFREGLRRTVVSYTAADSAHVKPDVAVP